MRLIRYLPALLVAASGSLAWGHGFELTLNFSGGVPVSMSSVSQASQIDQGGTPPSGLAVTNLFLDQFSGQGPLGANTTLLGIGAPTVPAGSDWQNTVEGGPNQVANLGSWQVPGFSQPNMTFSITSPLLYAGGTGPAAPASAGTLLYFSDSADANTASDSLHAALTGTSGVGGGWQLLNPYPPLSYGDAGHEIVKDLYVAPGSAQTAGEYGFAYTLTAHFAGGGTVTYGPLVDIFALDASGNTAAFLASNTLQDAATNAIFQALTSQSVATPEPASLVLILVAAIGAGLRWRWTRGR